MKTLTKLLLASYCFLATSSFAQHPFLLAEKTIYLYDSIDNSHYEFSGLAKWRNKILLIPQHRSAFDNYHIVAIDTASIDSVINNKALFASAATKLVFNQNLNALYDTIKQAILPRKDFGGFEAGVVVGDSIFLTIETDSICFVIKGIIDGKRQEINFSKSDVMSLEKPDYKFGNAGFESIAYLPKQRKLIAVYENNAITSAPTAFILTTDLKSKEAVTFARPMLFRLTDMAHVQGNTFVGLNHYYVDYSPAENCDSSLQGANGVKTEYCYYLNNNVEKAAKEMRSNPQQTSFTRIVQLTYNNNKIEWKEKQVISYASDNWEGILPYKKGVLMIVDGRPPGVPCKLAYFKLK